jgi:hypothetical protein
MYIRVSIPDIISITAIGATSWFTAGHEVTWGLWIGFGAFALGRLTQWMVGR